MLICPKTDDKPEKKNLQPLNDQSDFVCPGFAVLQLCSDNMSSVESKQLSKIAAEFLLNKSPNSGCFTYLESESRGLQYAGRIISNIFSVVNEYFV